MVGFKDFTGDSIGVVEAGSFVGDSDGGFELGDAPGVTAGYIGVGYVVAALCDSFADPKNVSFRLIEADVQKPYRVAVSLRVFHYSERVPP